MGVSLRSSKSSQGFSHRLRRDVVGIMWVAAGIFVSLALATFHPSDPSFNSVGSGLVARNACGFVGSFLADLLFQGFGMGAWLFVYGCARMAWRTFSDHQSAFLARLAWGLSLLLTTSSLLSLHLPMEKVFGGHIPVGGLFGAVLVKGLVAVLNSAGVAVLLWTVALILVIFYSEKSVEEWAQTVSASFRRIQSMIAAGWKALEKSFERQIEARAASAAGGRPAKEKPAEKSSEKGSSALAKVLHFKTQLKAGTDFEEGGSEKRLFDQSEDGSDEESGDEVENDSADESQDSSHSAAPVKPVVTALKRRPVKLQTKVNRVIENWKLPVTN